MFVKDVGELGNDVTWSCITQTEEEIPRNCFVYMYGYSCKHLSTPNNFSKDYKQDSLNTKKGSTGVTWAGNISYVEVAKPPLVMIENVESSRRGQHFQKMTSDLNSAGYEMFDMTFNSCEAGLPQDRKRAWFYAIIREWCGEAWLDEFRRVVDMLKLTKSIPLSRFLMCPRERDLLRIVHEGPIPCDPSVCPTLELKFSAPRVLHHARATHRLSSCTKCLLPSSKLMVWPPVVKVAAISLGLRLCRCRASQVTMTPQRVPS